MTIVNLRNSASDSVTYQQISTPTDRYDNPANRFVAGFIGSPHMNFLTGDLAGDGRRVEGAGYYTLPLDDRHQSAAAASSERAVWVGIRPEHLPLADEAGTNGSTIRGHVEPIGPVHEVQVNVGGTLINVQLDRYSGVTTGDDISLRVDDARVHLCEQGSERSLTSYMN